MNEKVSDSNRIYIYIRVTCEYFKETEQGLPSSINYYMNEIIQASLWMKVAISNNLYGLLLSSLRLPRNKMIPLDIQLDQLLDNNNRMNDRTLYRI